MDVSYLTDLRSRYSGKDLEKRIDALQIELFQFEEERILYHPTSQKIWAAIISFITVVTLTTLFLANLPLGTYYDNYRPASPPNPLALFIMGLTMLLAWLFGWMMMIETFKPKVSMEEAKKITLRDFMRNCECQVVCGRRCDSSYHLHHSVPGKKWVLCGRMNSQ